MQIALPRLPLFHTRTLSLTHMHSFILSLSLSRSLCSLMFYLISHNKASLWTAINCVWIFPLRRNRELSERAPVPQAAFILMQRSIAIFIAGSITHVTVVLWLGPLHRKNPDNITAEVCKTIQLWCEEGGKGWRAAGGFRRQEGMNFDSAAVTDVHEHGSLCSTAVGYVKQKALGRPQDVVTGCCWGSKSPFRDSNLCGVLSLPLLVSVFTTWCLRLI